MLSCELVSDDALRGTFLLLRKKKQVLFVKENMEGEKKRNVTNTTSFKTYLQEQKEEFSRQIVVLHLSQELHDTHHLPLVL